MAKKVATKGGKPVAKKSKPESKKEAAERIPGLHVGLKTGQKVGEFINGLLLAQRKKSLLITAKDRTGIMTAIAKEFPKKDHFQPFGSYLNYFNGGLHGYGVNDEPLPKEKRLKQEREKKEKDDE